MFTLRNKQCFSGFIEYIEIIAF